MADVALQQCLRPDPESPGAVQHAATPCALVHEPIRAARVGKHIERRERGLDQTWPMHCGCRRHNGG